jgi:nitronate monooxygenase
MSMAAPTPVIGEPRSRADLRNTEKQMISLPDHRLLDLLEIELPIILAPMAGPGTAALAIAVAEAGGLGSLACVLLSPDQARAEFAAIRQGTSKPINMNFFCHAVPPIDAAREAAWRRRLTPYFVELGLDPEMPAPASSIPSFGSVHCDLVAELKPEIVSFHFGLPSEDLLSRVKATGAKVLSSATTVKEAVWLQQRGCDAIIAQGVEAGGHRGMFLSDTVATQVGTIALVPQLVDAVNVPVIAAGGIADGRGIAAAFALGASGVQMGTAYLFCPEANVAPLYRHALKNARDDQTAITNIFTGRAARAMVNRITEELGPVSEHAPAFPTAGAALAPLRAKAEAAGSDDFSSLWSGQAARLGRELPARQLTVLLAEEALAVRRRYSTENAGRQ